MASYPTSVKTFTTRLAGDTIQPGHMNDVQDEINAIETDLLAAEVSPAFDAGAFTASSGTWTVEAADVITLAYKKLGRFMSITYYISNTSVSSHGQTELRITVPGGFTVNRTALNPCVVRNSGGADAAGYCQASSATTYLAIKRMDGSAWSTATNNTGVWGQINIFTTA